MWWTLKGHNIALENDYIQFAPELAYPQNCQNGKHIDYSKSDAYVTTRNSVYWSS